MPTQAYGGEGSQCHPQTASANFLDGHANAVIYGPGGVVSSDRLRIGVSLLAPGVRHPDYCHTQVKVYLVVSEGEFRLGEDDWGAPGYRSVLYTEPNIIHAMRSVARPLLAFWAFGYDF
ncbi:dimethylsulfonioproprionate lyase family protein [Pseudomonas sp. ABFPK]|uniref:dimethylsulfonioproprionate lyase family protein n=1 Tax=Pseudomonas sp. ABFPK TaxID=1636605 RepID=UPI003528F20B